MIILLGVIVIAAQYVVAAPACGLELISAREVPDTYGLTLAIKKDQRVVMYDRRLLATSVLAVLNSPYERTRSALRDIARDHFGETAWHETTQVDSTYWEARYGRRAPDEDKEVKVKELKAAQIVVDKYREISYESGDYNILQLLQWRRGYSRLTVRILDGRDIFLRVSTILWLQRKDEVYDWGWAFHLPIPSFHLQGAVFVSNEELDIIHGVAKSVGASFTCYPDINYSRSLLDSTLILIKAAEWLKDQP